MTKEITVYHLEKALENKVVTFEDCIADEIGEDGDLIVNLVTIPELDGLWVRVQAFAQECGSMALNDPREFSVEEEMDLKGYSIEDLDLNEVYDIVAESITDESWQLNKPMSIDF